MNKTLILLWIFLACVFSSVAYAERNGLRDKLSEIVPTLKETYDIQACKMKTQGVCTDECTHTITCQLGLYKAAGKDAIKTNIEERKAAIAETKENLSNAGYSGECAISEDGETLTCTITYVW